jgi:hypothetical protein
MTSSLEDQYPVDSCWELTLSNTQAVVRGRIFTLDADSRILVLQTPLTHTTLACKVHLINADQIVASVQLEKDVYKTPSPLAVVTVTKKGLEEKEKRAIQMMEESFQHINQKVSGSFREVFGSNLCASCVCLEVWKNGVFARFRFSRVSRAHPTITAFVYIL